MSCYFSAILNLQNRKNSFATLVGVKFEIELNYVVLKDSKHINLPCLLTNLTIQVVLEVSNVKQGLNRAKRLIPINVLQKSKHNNF